MPFCAFAFLMDVVQSILANTRAWPWHTSLLMELACVHTRAHTHTYTHVYKHAHTHTSLVVEFAHARVWPLAAWQMSIRQTLSLQALADPDNMHGWKERKVDTEDYSNEVCTLQTAAQSFTKVDGQLVRLFLNAPVLLQPEKCRCSLRECACGMEHQRVVPNHVDAHLKSFRLRSLGVCQRGVTVVLNFLGHISEIYGCSQTKLCPVILLVQEHPYVPEDAQEDSRRVFVTCVQEDFQGPGQSLSAIFSTLCHSLTSDWPHCYNMTSLFDDLILQISGSGGHMLGEGLGLA
eukprot:269369-Pelagomonas_calceolata.AAC.4